MLLSAELAPGGLLFCVRFARHFDLDRLGCEIIALDAHTLQLRHRFGQGLLNDTNGLAVGGDELYVCDTDKHRLQVFSLTGEHRRSIMGEWRSPEQLSFAKDRVYLLEQFSREAPVQGRRIFVLSLLGDILQVMHPTDTTEGCCRGSIVYSDV